MRYYVLLLHLLVYLILSCWALLANQEMHHNLFILQMK